MRSARPRPLAAAAADPLARLDLNLLRVWLSVFDAGGVSAAALALGLSQPAVSSALARLRAQLGDPLFERRGNHFLPTAETRRLLPAVRAALAGLGEALGPAPGFAPASTTRRFRVAMTDAGATVLLPLLAERLAAAGPGLGIEVLPFAFGAGPSGGEGAAGLGGALARGELDAALGPPAAGADELQSHALFSERYVGLVKRGGVLDQAAGSRRQLPAAVLRGARLVVVDQAATHHRVVPALLASRGLQSQVVAVVPLFAAVPGLVDAFDAVALVPSEIAALYARRRVAAWVHLPWALPAFPICWVTHPSRHRDAGLAWLGREVVAAVAARGSRAAPRAARREPAAP